MRIKVSATYKDFGIVLKRLRKIDSENQANFASGRIRKHQYYLQTEAVFFTAYRDYENFIRDVFLLYTQGKKTLSGTRVNSYLNPRSFDHAEAMIKSSMPFLDWNSPGTVIGRAELYLKDGFPIKLPYTTEITKLVQFRKIRNHIAHNSEESLKGYKQVLLSHFGVVPLRIPSVGEYLQLTSRTDATKYNLLVFFDTVDELSTSLTRPL